MQFTSVTGDQLSINCPGVGPDILDRYMDSLQLWGVLASRRVPTFHMAADWILSSHLTQERKIDRRDDL